MILTPIARDALAPVLDRFMAGLGDPFARAVFRQIRSTSPERAVGAEAETHRRAACSLARRFGMAIHPPDARCAFNWDGKALNGATEAYVILHEIAHFALASPERRGLADFGLGPGPDTVDRDGAQRAAVLSPLAREADEAAASLLGIVWEAELRHPALASFLDQNWLEGLERMAAVHFTAVLGTLRPLGLFSLARRGGPGREAERRSPRAEKAKTAAPGCEPDRAAQERTLSAHLTLTHRFARPASTRSREAPCRTLSASGSSPDLPSASPRQPPVERPIGIGVPRSRRCGDAPPGNDS